MILQRTLDTVAGLYDFTTTGGAIGSYDLQIPLPDNAFIVEFMAYAIIMPVGGLGATFSFDAIDTTVFPNTTNVGALIPASLLALFAFNAVVIGVNPGGGGVTPYKALPNQSIGFSIGVAALTAGQIQFYCRYVSFDF